jgi:hypothetical protein
VNCAGFQGQAGRTGRRAAADLKRLVAPIAATLHNAATLPFARNGRKDGFGRTGGPRVVAWLEYQPERTAKELRQRLRDEGSDFSDGQLRTLQRRVKEWRMQAARRLIFGGRARELDEPEPVQSA